MGAGFSAADIIHLLDLRPHPEGGHFRETFRDPAQDANGRSVSTLIYFLLRAGDVSRWHKVDATEVWHFYAGAPLQISVSRNGSETVVHPPRCGSCSRRAPAICCSRPSLAERQKPWALDARWLLRCARLRIFRLRTRSVSCAGADPRQVIPRTGKAHRLRCPSGSAGRAGPQLGSQSCVRQLLQNRRGDPVKLSPRSHRRSLTRSGERGWRRGDGGQSPW
jgi:hypothetical protein